MSGKRKLGVIGAGGIFKAAHLKAWMEHTEVEAVAVCDINEGRAREIASLLGVDAVYTDYKEMLRQEELDIVDISTPNLYHSEIAIAALNQGIHVLCEKPDAVSPAEAQKMAAAAAASGRVLMAVRNNRFTPSSQFLKRYADEGGLGEIYTGRCGWIRRRGIPGKGGWFTTKELSGGGPLIDLGVHFIDLATWIMGNPKPVAVSGATYAKFAHNELSDSAHSAFGEKREDGVFDVEDLATGFIRFENGATLQIEFSWASNIEEETNFVELRGTKAGASLRMGELKLFGEAAGQLVDLSPVKTSGSAKQHHEGNIAHFVDCVQGRAKPIITPEHGVDMIKILSAIYESAASGKELHL
ncbi:Gfo/Idh/MocA family protein [Paenibacillus arenilitoris]|uniref:Gfo/Idh/MocA family oxidoreductase n=1 Tax=Paenibacillus arenilitoris TaxID=2772299 RepID=A0A927CLZ7_9BACL|nr:Gfo/Idh/MocA family oxidoreductase [Paenibacillus arenilitoris]MBD2868626.1 Gfo/Idh/MocA family oxidoreductase [Paenibacillus arenilitoris]